MPLIDKLYSWLAARPDPQLDGLLGDGLAMAEPAYVGRIAAVLLGRKSEGSWAALLANFPRLDARTQSAVLANGDLLVAGAALALGRPGEGVRLAVLSAMDRVRSARLAYLLPPRLRDATLSVRDAAARLLRDMVEQHVDSAPAPDRPNEAYDAERRLLVQTVGEALRSFELHHRVEALQAALWLARDLDEALWRVLTSVRSRAALVVHDHLALWDHPRLAPFLLMALRQPQWRDAAIARLSQWSTAAQAAALLRETELLEDTAIRNAVQLVRGPHWFDGWVGDPTLLSERLRRHVPTWVMAAGFEDGQRVRLLTACLREADPQVRRAALYGLVAIDTPTSRASLRSVAGESGREARFAAWFLAGAGAIAPTRRHGTAGGDWDRLWREALALAPTERTAQIERLRRGATAVPELLAAKFESSDAQQRLLALQVIAAEPLHRAYPAELRRLANDPVVGIRRVASAMLARLTDGGEDRQPAAAATEESLRQLREALAERERGDVSTEVAAALEGLHEEAAGGISELFDGRPAPETRT